MSARDDLYLFAMVGKAQEDGNRQMAVRKLDGHAAEVRAEVLWQVGGVPCSPEWNAAHPGECATAPRVPGDGDVSHWHPRTTANSRRAAGRVAGLLEAAALADNDDTCDCGGCTTCVFRRFAMEIRALAAAGQAPAPQPSSKVSKLRCHERCSRLGYQWPEDHPDPQPENGRLNARIAELERPGIEAKRTEIRASFTELISQAEQDGDYEGAFNVRCRLREREEQWRAEDAHTPAPQPETAPTYWLHAPDGPDCTLWTTERAALDAGSAYASDVDPRGGPYDWVPQPDGRHELWTVDADNDRPISATGAIVMPITPQQPPAPDAEPGTPDLTARLYDAIAEHARNWPAIGVRHAQARQHLAEHLAPVVGAELATQRAQYGSAVATVADVHSRLTREQREHNADREERDRLRARVAELETAERERHRQGIRATLRAGIERAEMDGTAAEAQQLSDETTERPMALHLELPVTTAGKDTRTARQAAAGESTQPDDPNAGDEVVTCSNPRCQRGEWHRHLTARGWEPGGMGTWQCPQCAADAEDRREFLARESTQPDAEQGGDR